MKQVPIQKVPAGARLAADLRGHDGAMILSRGTVLSPSMISRLNRMHITQVAIDDPSAVGNENGLQAKLSDLERRFAGHEQNPWMMEIKRIAKNHLCPETPSETTG